MKILTWLAAGTLAGFAGGCAAVEVQAPYDGFVCGNASYEHCLAQSNTLSAFKAKSFGTPIGPKKVADDQVLQTKDKTYSCSFSHAPYSSTLDKSKIVTLVFVSPLLISQIEEQRVRVDKARESCARIIESYDYQTDLIAVQDELAKLQGGSSRLEAEVELERLKHDSFGKRTLTADEAKSYGLASGTVADAINKVKAGSVDSSEKIRDLTKMQNRSVDYARLFDDAQLQVDVQLRELAREYFVLDRAAYEGSKGEHLRDYVSGAWVAKGTVVMKSRVQPQ